MTLRAPLNGNRIPLELTEKEVGALLGTKCPACAYRGGHHSATCPERGDELHTARVKLAKALAVEKPDWRARPRSGSRQSR